MYESIVVCATSSTSIYLLSEFICVH